MTKEEMKRQAAVAALKYVQPGMVVGLGSGSTSNYFIEALGAKVREGLDIKGVASSEATHLLAQEQGIPLTTLEDDPQLHVTIDGADEIDHNFNLIKGGGAALLREKIVATSSRFMVTIADESKLVKQLGKFPLPVEVVAFGTRATGWKMERLFKLLKLEAKMSLRNDGTQAIMTENGNFIIDCELGAIPDPLNLDSLLNSIPGVVDTGLFVNICGFVLLGTPNGVKELKKA